MQFAFFNSGSVYFFKPFKPIYDIRNDGVKQNALEFHKDIVKERNDPSVFILDNHGKLVEVK